MTISATAIGAPPEATTTPAASRISHEISEGYEPPSRVTTYSLPSHGRVLLCEPRPVQSSFSKTIHSELSASVPAEAAQSPRLPEVRPAFLWSV